MPTLEAPESLRVAHVRTIMAPYLAAAVGMTGIETLSTPLASSSSTTSTTTSTTTTTATAAELAASQASSPLFSRLSGGANLLFLIRTAGESALLPDARGALRLAPRSAFLHEITPSPNNTSTTFSASELEVADRLLLIALAAMDSSAPHGSSLGSNLSQIQKSATSAEPNSLAVSKTSTGVGGGGGSNDASWSTKPPRTLPFNKHSLVAGSLYHPSFSTLLQRVFAIMPNAVRALARQVTATLQCVTLPLAVAGHRGQSSPWSIHHSADGSPVLPHLTLTAPGYLEIAGPALFQLTMDITTHLMLLESNTTPRSMSSQTSTTTLATALRPPPSLLLSGFGAWVAYCEQASKSSSGTSPSRILDQLQKIASTNISMASPTFQTPFLQPPTAFDRALSQVVLGASKTLRGGGPIVDEMLRSRLDASIAPLLQMLAVASSLPVPEASSKVVSLLMCSQALRKAVHCGAHQHRSDTESTAAGGGGAGEGSGGASSPVLLSTNHHLELIEAFVSTMIVVRGNVTEKESDDDDDVVPTTTTVQTSPLMSVMRDLIVFSGVIAPIVSSRKIDLCKGTSRFGYNYEGCNNNNSGDVKTGNTSTAPATSTPAASPTKRAATGTTSTTSASQQPSHSTTSSTTAVATTPPAPALSSSDPFLVHRNECKVMPQYTSPLASSACTIPMSFLEQYNVHTAMTTVLFAMEEVMKVQVLEIGRYGFSSKEASLLRKEASDNKLNPLAFLEIRAGGALGVGVGGRVALGAGSPSLAPPTAAPSPAGVAGRRESEEGGPSYIANTDDDVEVAQNADEGGGDDGTTISGQHHEYNVPPPLSDDRSEIESDVDSSSVSGASEIADCDNNADDEDDVVGRGTSLMPAIHDESATTTPGMVVGDSSVTPSANASPSPHRIQHHHQHPTTTTTTAAGVAPTSSRAVHFDPVSVARSPSGLRDDVLESALRTSEMYTSMVFPPKTPPSAASIHASICMSSILLTCSRTNIEYAIPTHQGLGSIRSKLEQLRALRHATTSTTSGSSDGDGEDALRRIPLEAAEEYCRGVSVVASPSMSGVYPIPLSATTISSTAQLSPATVITLVQWLFQSFASSPLPITAAALLHMMLKHYTVCADITVAAGSIYGRFGVAGSPPSNGSGGGWNEADATSSNTATSTPTTAVSSSRFSPSAVVAGAGAAAFTYSNRELSITSGKSSQSSSSTSTPSSFTLYEAVLIATNRAIQCSVASVEDGNLGGGGGGEGSSVGASLRALAENVIPHAAWPLYSQLCLVCIRMGVDRNKVKLQIANSHISGSNSPTTTSLSPKMASRFSEASRAVSEATSPTGKGPKPSTVSSSSSRRKNKPELPMHLCREAQRALLQFFTTTTRFYISDEMTTTSSSSKNTTTSAVIKALTCGTGGEGKHDDDRGVEELAVNAYRHRTTYSSSTRILLRAVDECLHDCSTGSPPEVLRWGLVTAWRSAQGHQHTTSTSTDAGADFDPSLSFATNTPSSQRFNFFELLEEADGDECVNGDILESIYAAIAITEAEVPQWQDTKELRWLQRREVAVANTPPASSSTTTTGRRATHPPSSSSSSMTPIFERGLPKRHYHLSLSQAAQRVAPDLNGNLPVQDVRVLVGVGPQHNLYSSQLARSHHLEAKVDTVSDDPSGRTSSSSSSLSGPYGLTPQQMVWVLTAAYVYLQRQWWISNAGQCRQSYHEAGSGEGDDVGGVMKHYGLVMPSAL